MNIHGVHSYLKQGVLGAAGIRRICMGWSWVAACGVQGRGISCGLVHSLLKGATTVAAEKKSKRKTARVVFLYLFFSVFFFFSFLHLILFSALSYSLYRCVNCFSVFVLFVQMEIIIIIMCKYAHIIDLLR